MALWETGFEQQFGQNWVEKGKEALSEGNNAEAAGFFSKAIEADPFNAGAYAKLGGVYWAQGKTEDCLNSLLKALELEPGDRDTVVECVRVFTALGKEDFAKEVLEAYLGRNPYDEEIRSRLDALLKRSAQGGSPEVAEFFNRQGEIQFERGNIAHAAACFEMAIEEDPRIGEAYNNLGVIELEAGKTSEALKNFLKALELRPEDGDIMANSARGLALAAQVDVAIDMYREYLRRFPKDNKAWEEFEALIRKSAGSAWRPDGLSSDVAEIYRRTAEELLNAGDLPGASEAVEKALKLKPEAPDSLYLLASLHCAIGQEAEARRALELALGIDPAHARCSDMLQSLENGGEGQVG